MLFTDYNWTGSRSFAQILPRAVQGSEDCLLVPFFLRFRGHGLEVAGRRSFAAGRCAALRDKARQRACVLERKEVDIASSIVYGAAFRASCCNSVCRTLATCLQHSETKKTLARAPLTVRRAVCARSRKSQGSRTFSAHRCRSPATWLAETQSTEALCPSTAS